jgi:hypothetical protein
MTGSLFLLFDPGNVFLDRFVLEEQFLRVVLVGKFFFVWDQVVDAIMTFLTEHEALIAHDLFAKPVDVSFLPMNRPGDQMMLRQSPLTTAQVAAAVRSHGRRLSVPLGLNHRDFPLESLALATATKHAICPIRPCSSRLTAYTNRSNALPADIPDCKQLLQFPQVPDSSTRLPLDHECEVSAVAASSK